jgi:urease alpha subunit
MFVSKAGVESGSVNSYGLEKQIEIVRNTRTVTKLDMKFNNATPKMEVDPEAFVSLNSVFETLEYDTDFSITDGYGRWCTL